MLMQSLIEWAEKNETIEKLTLAVFSTNVRAIALYKKLGFAIEGMCHRDIKIPDGTYVDSILMYKFVKWGISMLSV
jgi:RimJ/RimL family protein N-acetyltransferase